MSKDGTLKHKRGKLGLVGAIGSLGLILSSLATMISGEMGFLDWIQGNMPAITTLIVSLLSLFSANAAAKSNNGAS